MSSFEAAELAIFVILIIPVFYILFKHGKPGILGWLYLAIFCTLKIIGGGMGLSHNKAASIVSNIGLSPLLFAVMGIVHESRTYLFRDLNKKIEWLVVLQYHLFVTAGVAVLAAGSAALQGGSPEPKDLTLVKAGMAILTISWIGLVAGTAFTIYVSRNAGSLDAGRSGTKLLWSAAVTLIFLGIHVIYSLVALTSQRRSINPSTGSLAVKVVLSLLPDLISTLILIASGVLTRNIGQEGSLSGGQDRKFFV